MGLCWLICLAAGATTARAEGAVKVTYQGHMVSFRTTGAKEALFGHYTIEVNWTETAFANDSTSLTLKAKAPFTVGSFMSSIEEESRLTITATAPGLVKPVSGSWTLVLKRPRRR